MIFGNRRYSRPRAIVSLVTMTTFLAGMLPLRSARADVGPFPPIQQGTGGGPTLAGPQSQAGSADALATVDLATGAAKSSFAFRLPTARGQAQPSLSLVYSSSTAVGLAGVGWTLDLPSIERRGSSGMPNFDDDVLGASPTSDKYVFGGTPLVPICTLDSNAQCPGATSTNAHGPQLQAGETVPPGFAGWTYFRTEIDDGMRFFLAPDRHSWRVQTKQGVTMIFGEPPDALVGGAPPVEAMHEPLAVNTTSALAIYRWNLSRQVDTSGNGVYYVWSRPEVNAAGGVDATLNQGREYLVDIYDTLKAGFDARSAAELYFAHHVHLAWSRPDGRTPLAALSPSWRTPPSLHLEQVDITSSPLHGGLRELVRRYWLDYDTLDHWASNVDVPKTNTQMFLAGIRLEGTCGHKTEHLNGLLPPSTNCPQLPVLSMTYTEPDAVSPPNETGLTDVPGPYFIADANGDSIPDVFHDYGAGYAIQSAPGLQAQVPYLFGPSPPDDASRFALGDWLGDGQTNWLWFDISTSEDGALNPAQYEIYSLKNSVGAGVYSGGSFVGFERQLTCPGCPAIPHTGSGEPDFQTGRAMDIDGDGLTDMALVPSTGSQLDAVAYYTQRDSTGAIIPVGRTSASTCLNNQMWGFSNLFSGHDTQRVVTDVDGDGLPDVVVLENTIPNDGGSVFGDVTAHVFKNRGDGRFGGPDAEAPQCANVAYAPYDIDAGTGGGITKSAFSSIAFHDVDGDGLADLVWVDPNGVNLLLQAWDPQSQLFTFVGVPRFKVDVTQLDCSKDPSHGVKFDQSAVSVQFADMNASGVDDIVVFACGAMTWFDVDGGQRPGLLESISNDAGATTKLAYESLAKLQGLTGGYPPTVDVQPPGNVPVPVQVVTSATTTNGLSGPYAQNEKTSYTYGAPVYDARDRAFLGFQTVTAKQPGTIESPGVDTTTQFVTYACPVSPGQPCAPTKDYGWHMQRGLPAVVQQWEDTSIDKDNGGRELATRLTTTINTYDYDWLYQGADGRVVRQVYPEQTDTYLWDRGNQSPAQVSPTVLRGSSVPSAFDVTLQSVEVPDRSGAHLLHISHMNGFGNADWTLDRGLLNRPATQPPQPQDTPVLTQATWALPQGDPTGWDWRPVVATTSYADAYGNATGPSREVDFDYYWNGLLKTMAAPLQGTVPLARTNPGGQVAPPPDDASHDSQPGQPLVLSSLSYDAYGNVHQIVHAGGQCSGLEYDPLFAQLPTTIDEYLGPCGGTKLVTSRTYDRGLEVITGELSPAGHLSTATYDAFGRMTAAYQPSAAAPLKTSPDPVVSIDYSLYDNIDPNKPVRRLKVTTLATDDRAGQSNMVVPVYRTEWQYIDGLGQPLATVGQTETAGQWVVSGARALDSTTGRAVQAWRPFFVNLAQGSQYDVQSTPGGASSQLWYDGLGRITQQQDESQRTSKVTYEASTLSVMVQDPEQLAGGHANASTTLVYDGHGRLIQRVAALPNAPTSDTIATAYTYLATGEITQIQKTHAKGSDVYTRWMTYDSLGRMVTNFEPNTSSEHIVDRNGLHHTLAEWRYAYNDAGQLVGTSDARGCGENIKYDPLGRILGEDYSPCDASSQAAYSSANWSTGVGLESRYVYDTPEVGGQPSVFYRGFLTASYDRAQHMQLELDGRGRVTAVHRQVTAPVGVSVGYAPHWFERDLSYDDANHVVGATTGADVPELLPGGASSVFTHYSVRGSVDGVMTTYGDGHLLDSRTFWPSGEPQTSILGDVSHVTEDAQYNVDGSLHELHLHRSAGPWAPQTSTYTPAAATDPVNIGDLQDLLFQSYDGAGHPTAIADQSMGAWPSGTSPVTRQLTYDDAYRLTKATLTYASGQSDGFKSPYAAEEQKGDHSFPALAPLPQQQTRPQFQSFSYDWLDNVQASNDDQPAAPDRSFGVTTYPTAGSYDAAPNQMTSATQGGTTIAASYDAAGNTTGVTVTRTAPCSGPCVSQYKYQWDELGRLQLAERDDGDTATSTQIQVAFGYLYDAAGQRVVSIEVDDARPDAARNVSYDVDVFPSLQLHTSTIDGNNDYARGPDSEIVYLQDGAGQTYGRTFYDTNTAQLPSPSGSRLHVFLELGDHLGSNAVVLDKDSGEVVERASYLTYGAVDTDLRPDRWGDFRASYRYTGHRDAAEVGLIYFGARYYLPMLARWASPDPLTIHALGAQMNPYGFVGGSPLANVDPAGLDGCDSLSSQCGDGGGGGLGIIGAWAVVVATAISNYHTNPQRGSGGFTVSTQLAPTLTPWSGAGSSSFITAAVTSSPTRWVDPTGLGGARWNPNGFGGTATMLLGVPTSLTLDEVAPELAHAIHVVGPLVLQALPPVALAMAATTMTDTNASGLQRFVVAPLTIAAAVVPGIGGELSDAVSEGGALLEESLSAEGTWAAEGLDAGATRRLATEGDTQFRTQQDALAEALERHGVDPSTVEVTSMYGKNPNLIGPKGQPWEIVRGLNSDGELIQFEHHASGHFFGDTNEFELPHYHGPNGEHLTY